MRQWLTPGDNRRRRGKPHSEHHHWRIGSDQFAPTVYQCLLQNVRNPLALGASGGVKSGSRQGLQDAAVRGSRQPQPLERAAGIE